MAPDPEPLKATKPEETATATPSKTDNMWWKVTCTNPDWSGPTGLIHGLMPQLIEAIGPVPKGQKHPQGWRFRGVDDAMNALSPALVKLGLGLGTDVLENSLTERMEKWTNKRGEIMPLERCVTRATVKIEIKYYASDGSWRRGVAVGEGLDYADKATSKAMSQAYKYAVFQPLSVAIKGMEDADQHTPQSEPPQTSQSQPAKPDPARFDWPSKSSGERRDYLISGMDQALVDRAEGALKAAREFTRLHQKDLNEADYTQLMSHVEGCLKELGNQK